MRRSAVKGRPPQILSSDTIDQFQLGRPCQLFAEFFLQLPKVGVITVLTRKPKSPVFQAYLLQKETKCVLNAYILYQQPIIMFGNDLVIIVTCIRVQLTYFT